MNCPNCNKQPIGFIHSLKLGHVPLNKSLLGYFRCRHCNTLLKQQRYAGILAKFDVKFWIIVPLLFVMIALLPELLTDLIVYLFPSLAPETFMRSDDPIPPIFFIFGFLFIATLLTAFVIFFRSMFRFMKFTTVGEAEQLQDDSYKISPVGWIIFAAFLMIYLFTGYLLVFNNAEFFAGIEWMYTLTLVVYLFILIGVSGIIAKHFSDNTDAEIE